MTCAALVKKFGKCYCHFDGFCGVLEKYGLRAAVCGAFLHELYHFVVTLFK